MQKLCEENRIKGARIPKCENKFSHSLICMPPKAAYGSKEAGNIWRDGKYDLLLLDLSLPDGSGFELCKKVRQVSKVPIIFLTASDEEMSIVMGLDMGGDDYITKPFKLGVLTPRINALPHF